jgi:hypothetical protein
MNVEYNEDSQQGLGYINVSLGELGSSPTLFFIETQEIDRWM